MAWLPTPYVTLSFGIGGSAIQSLTFTTLSHLNSKKYITGGTITQTSKTTIKFDLSLVYYPGTFSVGDGNDLLVRLNLAMSNEKTRDIFLQFGYYSNSPYTGGAESSPIYKGLITNITSKVERNCVRYQISGYGEDLLFGFGWALDTTTDKYITKNTKIQDFLVSYLLNNGKLNYNGQNFNFNIIVDNLSFGSKKLIDLVMGTYEASLQQINITNSYAGIPGWASQSVKASAYANAVKATNALKDEMWNKTKKKFTFRYLASTYLDRDNLLNTNSANIEQTLYKTQFSIFEVIEMFNRMLNSMTKQNYEVRCFVEPYSNGTNYDGTIVIYDVTKPLSSKKNFFWGRWSSTAGVLSNKNTVVSWSCDYNATAKLFSGKNAGNLTDAQSLYKNLSTDIKLSISDNGDIIYELTSSQANAVGDTDYRLDVAQNTQYGVQLAALQKIFDYPYKATIEVLGICDAWQIARQRIKVYVYVNGVAHFTTGEYLILGYRHNVGVANFTTTYDLIKIPSDTTSAKKLLDIVKDIEDLSGTTASDITTKFFSEGGST